MPDNRTVNARLYFIDGREPQIMRGVDSEVTRLVMPGTHYSFIVTDELDADGYVVCREEPPAE